MSETKKFRACVAAIAINSRSDLLFCSRTDYPSVWQFPQGGIESGESEEAALNRELFEEIGVRYFNIIDKLPFKISYHWPETYRREGFIGQEQSFFLIELLKDEELGFIKNGSQEFCDYQWQSIAWFLTQPMTFKTEAYKKAIYAFTDRNPTYFKLT